MSMDKKVRFKQRFASFEKAYKLLSAAVALDHYNDLEKEGLVQRFEFTFELAWKTLKDLLESKGVSIKFPRDAIKEAFASGLLEQGELWLEMLDNRNLLSYTYQEELAELAFTSIKERYYGAIVQLYQVMRTEIDG